MVEGMTRRELRLPASRTSVRLARAELRRLLEETGREEWLDNAELALSELVTNAVVHVGGEVGLGLRVSDDCLRVEVSDASPHHPVARDYSPLAGTGRGLHIVGQLVSAWGVESLASSKVVWFEIGPGALAGQPADGSAPGARSSAADVVLVELWNFPLVMHAAWQEHASALLRERLLVGDEPDQGGGTVLVGHAHASEAMNVLFEQVPRLPPVDVPEQIMLSATEPHVSVDRLTLEVPRTSLPHFATLDAALEDSATMAEAGGLLVQPTQPEIRAFRHWVCSEVRRQGVDGGEPVPWSSTLPPHPRPPGPPIDWDPTPVTSSAVALLAADDSGHVVAVSDPALELLGYGAVDELCGHRLLVVVPARYHQAHVAGVTQHVTNGRDPLLRTPVTVPVVRADGSEVDLDLLVEVLPLPSGRRVFVAKLAAPGSMTNEVAR